MKQRIFVVDTSRPGGKREHGELKNEVYGMNTYTTQQTSHGDQAGKCLRILLANPHALVRESLP